MSDQNPSISIWARCDSYRCTACGPHKVARLVETMTYAARQHRGIQFWTLTQSPERYEQRRQKTRDLRRLLARRGHRVEFVSVTERGEGGMLHQHAIAHGDQVPPAVLDKVWGHQTHAQPVRPSQARSATGYCFKSAFVDLESHLDLNGHRAGTWTRNFLGSDLRTTSAALRVEQGRDRLTWHLELAA